MFGYVTANTRDLSPEQETRYRAAYCGLCETLKTRHGAFARFALNYDFVFLVLLLDSLYEPEKRACDARCAMHPLCAKRHEISDFTAYAADMTIALYYHKCLDDWKDDHNLLRRAQAAFFSKRYAAVAVLWPKQCEDIRCGLAKLQTTEQDVRATADAAASSFGEITAAIFAPRADHWAQTLRAFGMALGKFIYMMDAWEDCRKDLRRGSFNPLAADCLLPDFNARCTDILNVLMGDSAAEFEKLPLVEDIMLLRNVVYSGIWTRFEMKRAYERRRSNADHGSV